jgi:hypothetical protein
LDVGEKQIANIHPKPHAQIRSGLGFFNTHEKAKHWGGGRYVVCEKRYLQCIICPSLVIALRSSTISVAILTVDREKKCDTVQI